ncbi:NTP transferase domain-containing protein [Iamia sp. SCSIO 61187]|uniref:NTP transferase domain-containing protein n=1 Tax=Iamia sp. SCSIO 61187 TaxID=2722752 RepID=UPI001C62912D|nr:NTP transferase domain-containing protein [Iamia sp. SCSIO 61187]QYG93031.1 NTP transferase domain-containing protein [Iamia sp. SCSIO 61187]
MTDEISLVVLAAGMGRRFGALKQVAPVGPVDEALVDHTIRDAAAAGVDRVVVVVRPEIRAEVVEHLERRTTLPLVVVEQEGPAGGRTRPWGAAEAVALALAACPGPAVVVNADDHYGADAVAAVVAWLRSPAAGDGRAALVTWPLAATLSPRGPVSRAVCRVRGDGTLAGMVEHHDLSPEDRGPEPGTGRRFDPDAPVSMNLWGLPAAVGPALAETVAAFRRAHPDDPDAELPLPTAVDGLLAAGTLVVDVLPAGTTWVGVTHPDDLAPAQAAMARLAPVPERSAPPVSSPAREVSR